MSTTRTFTVIFPHEGEWWAAYVPDLPGAHSQGRTLEEARENIVEAIQLLIECDPSLVSQPTSPARIEQIAVSIAA
jgi:predicted RNase H-like HicB family nuclease